MKVRTQQPVVPTSKEVPVSTSSSTKQASQTAARSATAPVSISTSERQGKLAERGIAENFLRDQLMGDAAGGRRLSKNPAEGNNVLQDPRQHGLDHGADQLGANLGDELRSRAGDRDGHGPISGGSMDIGVAPPSDDGRPDALGGSFSPEERFEQAANDRINQRSAGGGKDPNAQSDGDPYTFTALVALGVLGMSSLPAGALALAGATVVGGVNYLYDAIIEDMDNDVPPPADPAPVGEGGGGDISEGLEAEGDLDYVVANTVPGVPMNGTQNPDDPSGDNPNPGWTPDLTPRSAVDARDTVRTPASPHGTDLSAEEIQARIDALGKFSPRTQNAINPGDQGGEVGRDANAPVPVNLPDEDPVGDPGSPEGPGEPTA